VPEQLTLLPASEQLKSVFEFDIVVPDSLLPVHKTFPFGSEAGATARPGTGGTVVEAPCVTELFVGFSTNIHLPS
jgi:hypothetical protein